jgi:hypothetical protein
MSNAVVSGPDWKSTAEVTMAYYSDDPFAIVMTVQDKEWFFDRKLLAQAVTSLGVRVGIGDVSMHMVAINRVAIRIGRRYNFAVVLFDVPLAKSILLYSYACVPAGQEMDHLNIDAAIEELLRVDDNG